MDAVQELGRGDRRDGDLLLGVRGDDLVPVEPATLGGDQQTGVDQRRHRDFGSPGWRRVMASRVSQ